MTRFEIVALPYLPDSLPEARYKALGPAAALGMFKHEYGIVGNFEYDSDYEIVLVGDRLVYAALSTEREVCAYCDEERAPHEWSNGLRCIYCEEAGA